MKPDSTLEHAKSIYNAAPSAEKQSAHDYMPDWLRDKIPPLYAQENDKNPVVWAKLFTPDAQWTWFITEKDPKSGLCFGYVIGLDSELGYISLDEIFAVRGSFGLRVERDLWWTPCRLDAVRK